MPQPVGGGAAPGLPYSATPGGIGFEVRHGHYHNIEQFPGFRYWHFSKKCYIFNCIFFSMPT